MYIKLSPNFFVFSLVLKSRRHPGIGMTRWADGGEGRGGGGGVEGTPK